MHLLPYIRSVAFSLCLLAGILASMLPACRKPDTALQASNTIYVIGHGGTGFSDLSQYPPNSWASIIEAIERYGADGVEVDIQMSRDGILFMYHDQHLDAASFCAGCLYEWPAQALADCRFKPRSGKKADAYITPVEQLLKRYAAAGRQPLIFLDLKNPLACFPAGSRGRDSYYRAALQEISRLIDKYQARDWVFLQSDSREWLSYCRDHYPSIRVLLDYIKDVGDIDYAAAAGFYGIAAPGSDLQAAEVNLARQKGLKIQLYGARLQEDMIREMGKLPDYFLSDNIPLTRRILAASSE